MLSVPPRSLIDIPFSRSWDWRSVKRSLSTPLYATRGNVQKMPESDKLTLIAEIAASYLRRNSVGIDQIGSVVASVTRAIEEAAKEIDGSAVPETRLAPTGASPK